MSETIRVDIWSDIACPWCFIGKRRFEQAVAAFSQEHPDVSIEVESHSYELAPDTPEHFSGSEIDFLVTHKGMPRQQVEEMLANMTAMAQAEGITFDFERLKHVNTRRAHRLLHLAKERGVQGELLEQLFRAYFSDGVDLGDETNLVGIAESVDIAPEDARAALRDEALGQAVDTDIRRAQAIGVNGVPFFLLNEKYAVSGAQPAETFVDVLAQVRQLSATPTPSAT